MCSYGKVPSPNSLFRIFPDPQQWNGYAYSNNSPVTFSDPDGRVLQWLMDGGGGGGPPGAGGALLGAGLYANVVALGVAVAAVTAANDYLEDQLRDDERDAQNKSGNGPYPTGETDRNGNFIWSDGSIRDKTGKIVLAIPGATRLSGHEQATAGRLLGDSSFTGGRLYEADDEAYDYEDSFGRTYDAIGAPGAFRYGDQDEFLKSLDHHVRKQGLNFIVLDLTGASSRQMDVIFSHIDQMSRADQSRILIVGD